MTILLYSGLCRAMLFDRLRGFSHHLYSQKRLYKTTPAIFFDSIDALGTGLSPTQAPDIVVGVKDNGRFEPDTCHGDKTALSRI